MSEKEFWTKIGSDANKVIDNISFLSKKSFISITDIESQTTWWSSRAVETFGLGDNYAQTATEKSKLKIHPDDRVKYREGFKARMKGQNLGVPLEYRVETNSGEYVVFTACSEMIYDEEHNPQTLVTVIDNNGIAEEIDAVTNLHNEIAFTRRIQTILNAKRPAAIIKISIESFNHINVMYGADFGDKVMLAVANELRHFVGNRGYVYRLPGIKYAICFDNISRYMLKDIYQSIETIMSQRIYVDHKKIPLKIAGGAILVDNFVGDVTNVKSRLTYALNLSRQARHGDLVLINEELNHEGNDSLEMISTIHQCALDGCEGFYLCYQPIADRKTGMIRGMEALVRWKKEPYGMVPPGLFIAWLEEDPCIFELGYWIMKQALTDAKKIVDRVPDFFVNVNVAAAQIERHEFRQSVIDILKTTNFPPNQFCMELTERCRELDIEFLKEEIVYFKEQGIKVAMDDFGTGSSSLSVALDLPVDELKIDMSFIKNIENKPFNQAMVQSIIDFANQTELETCIEGVENEEVEKYLGKYGATWHQGYFYSRPVPFDEFMEILQINLEQRDIYI